MKESRNTQEQDFADGLDSEDEAGEKRACVGIDRWLIEVKRLDWKRSPSRRSFDAWTHSLARAILRDDAATLSAAEEAFGHAQAHWYNQMSDTGEDGEVLGRLRALVSLAVFGLEVASPNGPLRELEPESVGTRFLSSLREAGDLSSSALATSLRVDPTEVSRTGSRLLSLEMVTRRRVGRRALWSLSARGRESLRSLLQEDQQERELIQALPHPALFVWGRATSREVKRRPSPFSLASVQPVDLLAEIIEDEQGRSKLGATLCMSASVQKFSSAPELSFEMTYRPNQPPEETGWQSLCRRFDRSFDFESFWPSASPAWHAQAILKGDDGRLGVLLIDVPDSPKQIANQESRLKRPDHAAAAKDAMYEAVSAFDLPPETVPNEPRYSDLLRRLVLIHYLRVHCDIQAWSARMCFVATGQSSRLNRVPSTQDAWEVVLNRTRREASLSPDLVSEWNQQHFVPVN